jgi:CheY-like chemotaxis protein
MSTVLLVEDDTFHRDAVADYLRAAGHVVVTASDGDEGVWSAAVHLPDVVLMDASLPSQDGWTAAARIRRIPELAAVPVVVLTSGDFPEHRALAAAAGVSFSLPKPTPLPEVLEVVRHCSARAAAGAVAAP